MSALQPLAAVQVINWRTTAVDPMQTFDIQGDFAKIVLFAAAKG